MTDRLFKSDFDYLCFDLFCSLHALTLEFNVTEGASPLSVQGVKYAKIGTGRALTRGI